MAEWEDKKLAETVLSKLGRLPPLVQASETESLKSMLAAAGRGERFFIQGGDCAERFMDCEGDRLATQLKTLLQMGMIGEHLTGKPPLVIARIAGQYGKPRSKPTEVVEGYGEIMSFKGDNINGFAPSDRKWDPERLLQGYFHSAATLNFLRSYTASADSKELTSIQLDALKPSPDYASYVESTKAIGAKYEKGSAPTQFFTAHEAMQLDLEEALTRKVGDKYYNLSAHLVWIGDRTRQIKGAHVEYFRGISNPVGCKVGPSMKADELQELVKVLNPNTEPPFTFQCNLQGPVNPMAFHTLLVVSQVLVLCAWYGRADMDTMEDEVSLLQTVVSRHSTETSSNSCACLVYSDVYSQHGVECGAAHELPGGLALKPVLGEEFCTNFFQRLSSNLCTQKDFGSNHPEQWCYVSAECQTLRGGAQIPGTSLSWKQCDPFTDAQFSALTPVQLMSVAQTQSLDPGLLLKEAYPTFDLGMKWPDVQKALLLNATDKVAELNRAILSSVSASGKPMIFDSVSSHPPYGFLIGHRVYEWTGEGQEFLCRAGCSH